MTSVPYASIALFGGLGLALGLVHFYGLRRDTRAYVARGLRLGAVALHVARLLATTAALVFIAKSGAVPLLAALGGFLAARFVAVAQVREIGMSAPSPLVSPVVFHLGAVPFTQEVVTTWGIIAVLGLGAYLSTRRLSLPLSSGNGKTSAEPSPTQSPGRVQAAVEALFILLEDQIRGVVQSDPAPLVPFVGTLFLFLAVANLSSLVPGVKAPTASIETPAALALIVFFAVHAYGIRQKGVWRYLKAFAQPSVLMLPLNVLSEITRTFSMMIRLFGNMMSHEFILGIVVTLVGLFVPIPFMALGILIGLIQAYIFAILATVFIGAAMESSKKASPES